MLLAFLAAILAAFPAFAGFTPGIWANPDPTELVTYNDCTVYSLSNVWTFTTSATGSNVRAEADAGRLPSVGNGFGGMDFSTATSAVYVLTNTYVVQYALGTWVDETKDDPEAYTNDAAYITNNPASGMFVYTGDYLTAVDGEYGTNNPASSDYTWTNEFNDAYSTNVFTNTIQRQVTLTKAFHQSVTVSEVEACALESLAAICERDADPMKFRPFLMNPRYVLDDDLLGWRDDFSTASYDWIDALEAVKDWIKENLASPHWFGSVQSGKALPYPYIGDALNVFETETFDYAYGRTGVKWLNQDYLTATNFQGVEVYTTPGGNYDSRFATAAPYLTLNDLYDAVPALPVSSVSVTDTWTNVPSWYAGPGVDPGFPVSEDPDVSYTFTNTAYYASWLDYTPRSPSYQARVSTNKYHIILEFNGTLTNGGVYVATNYLVSPPEAEMRHVTTTNDVGAGLPLLESTTAEVFETNRVYAYVFSVSMSNATIGAVIVTNSTWSLELTRDGSQVYYATNNALDHMVYRGTNYWETTKPWTNVVSLVFTNDHIAAGSTAADYRSWQYVTNILRLFTAVLTDMPEPTANSSITITHEDKPSQDGDPPCFYHDYETYDDWEWNPDVLYSYSFWNGTNACGRKYGDEYISDSSLSITYPYVDAGTYINYLPCRLVSWVYVVRHESTLYGEDFWFPQGEVNENELFDFYDVGWTSNAYWVGVQYSTNMTHWIARPPYGDEDVVTGWEYGGGVTYMEFMYYWQ